MHSNAGVFACVFVRHRLSMAELADIYSDAPVSELSVVRIRHLRRQSSWIWMLCWTIGSDTIPENKIKEKESSD